MRRTDLRRQQQEQPVVVAASFLEIGYMVGNRFAQNNRSELDGYDHRRLHHQFSEPTSK